MSNGIRWNLLSEDELDFLDRAGVQRLSTGIAFVRRPTWDDFRLAFAYLIALKTRTFGEEGLGICDRRLY